MMYVLRTEQKVPKIRVAKYILKESLRAQGSRYRMGIQGWGGREREREKGKERQKEREGERERERERER